MSTLEIIGSVFGIAGGILVASNTKWSRFGWIGFTISGICLTTFTYIIQTWGLFALQLTFCATNLIGLWRWLIKPWLASRAELIQASTRNDQVAS